MSYPQYDDEAPVQGDLVPPRPVFLSRDNILDAKDLEVREVHVPEWGGTVRVQGLTGAQRSRINATTVVSKGQSVEMKVEALSDLQIRMVAMALVDDDGERLFSDHDVAALGRKNAGVIERLFNLVQELSALAPGQAEAIRGN